MRSLTVASVAALALIATAAVAQDEGHGSVTVRASHNVTVQQVGTGYATGAPIDLVSVSHRVSYRDLDLATPAGQRALKRRIEDKAREGCRQISQLYPGAISETSQRECVAAAVKDAMPEEDAAVASARENSSRRTANR